MSNLVRTAPAPIITWVLILELGSILLQHAPDELTDVSLSINRHYRLPRNYKSEYGEGKLEDIKKVLQALFDKQRDGRIMLEGDYTYEDIDIYKRRRECS